MPARRELSDIQEIRQWRTGGGDEGMGHRQHPQQLLITCTFCDDDESNEIRLAPFFSSCSLSLGSSQGGGNVWITHTLSSGT